MRPAPARLPGPLAPGATIGILGGGQLGRMLALAAARLGFDVHIFTDEPDSPAARVSARTTIAAWDDQQALAAFAAAVDVVTVEFENVPAQTAEMLIAAGAEVRPPPRALAIAQDRVSEKTLFAEIGIAPTPFAAVGSRDELERAAARLGLPAVLKTRRLGYDGKGQVRITTPDEIAAAWTQLGAAPLILEAFVAFEREISVIAARGADGGFAAYDISENTHESGILRRSRAPARISPQTAAAAASAAADLARALDYVGVFALELFVMTDGRLLANEMAPRVHNSGHWTEAACRVSQFEQHIRAVAGWPLGGVSRFADCEMVNIIGAEADGWSSHAADPDIHLHLYGKRQARPGRKMGHFTRLLGPR